MIKVIGNSTIGQIAHEFLFVFHCKYVSCNVTEIFTTEYSRDLENG